jgi:hypothetical protein
MATQQLQRDKWFALIEEQEKSGLSASAFCKERNLKLAHMHSYRHQLKKRKAASSTDRQEKLVPVQIKSKDNALAISGEIRLILSNGTQCILPGQTEIAQIKTLVGILMSC